MTALVQEWEYESLFAVLHRQRTTSLPLPEPNLNVPGHGGEVRYGLDGADGGDEHEAEAVDDVDEDREGLHRDGGPPAGAVQLQVRVEPGRDADAADAQLRGRREMWFFISSNSELHLQS